MPKDGVFKTFLMRVTKAKTVSLTAELRTELMDTK